MPLIRTYRESESVLMSLPGVTRKRRERVAYRAGPQVRTPEPQSTEILSWAEVNLTHRIQNGVYQRNGRLISLLTDFGRINPCYPDRMADEPDTLLYTGNGRRGDQYLNPGNRALLAAIESGHRVPLFNKLAVGKWQHMGFWRVISGRQIFDQREQRMLWQFTLKCDPMSE
ncbi:MAG: hypothetical protein QOJ64_4011 [Acidobacteriota bacterium]|jgi:hypothetical protein|nr:hypothetical protein [Acidobacteriota bacterium]